MRLSTSPSGLGPLGRRVSNEGLARPLQPLSRSTRAVLGTTPAVEGAIASALALEFDWSGLVKDDFLGAGGSRGGGRRSGCEFWCLGCVHLLLDSRGGGIDVFMHDLGLLVNVCLCLLIFEDLVLLAGLGGGEEQARLHSWPRSCITLREFPEDLLATAGK